MRFFGEKSLYRMILKRFIDSEKNSAEMVIFSRFFTVDIEL